ncbi:MAG: sigma-70 family RNA polymerase sigma factor [Planctomycetaceae bacterium]|nr:sigma-70 family RNA polymerase sigma factor [Planctomycetaceae bacterium]
MTSLPESTPHPVATGAVTQMLDAIQAGRANSEQLLPLVYSELRKLASQRLAQESPGHTLQPTALVHEAYLRLVGPEDREQWDSRGHFFAAAAEAMRRILVENARRKQRIKHGGQLTRVDLLDADAAIEPDDHDSLLALDEALAAFAEQFPDKAQLVKLRYFAGLSESEAADVCGISRPTASRWWTFSRAWLFERLRCSE